MSMFIPNLGRCWIGLWLFSIGFIIIVIAFCPSASRHTIEKSLFLYTVILFTTKLSGRSAAPSLSSEYVKNLLKASQKQLQETLFLTKVCTPSVRNYTFPVGTRRRLKTLKWRRGSTGLDRNLEQSWQRHSWKLIISVCTRHFFTVFCILNYVFYYRVVLYFELRELPFFIIVIIEIWQ